MLTRLSNSKIYPMISASCVIVALVASTGCRREVAAAEIDPGSAVAAASGPGANSPASAQFEEAAFSLRLEPRAPYAVGKPGVVVLQLRAKEPHHINQEYPHKLKLKATDGVVFPQPVLGRDAMKIAEKSAELSVPFTPGKSGAYSIGGDFAFSLCTSDRCLMEKRTLAVSINVP
jgi:hypothetical protein